ncbi:MAG: class I SAM-dependent DNA methyltransferase [Methanobacterium sp.]
MTKEQLYKKFAKYYDKIYEKMDYQKEAEFIKWAVKTYKGSPGNELLDVACGTGTHAHFLKKDFKITCFDINDEMLKIAREKLPDIHFIKGDMKTMDLELKFDVLICMFSAINYNTAIQELEITLNNFYSHLKDGGVLIFDMGLNKENWIEGIVSMDTVVDNNFKLARIWQSHLEKDVFNSSFVYLVKEDGILDFEIDEHKLGVFGMEDVVNLMEKAGFEVFISSDFKDEEWQLGTGERPVFVGVK